MTIPADRYLNRFNRDDDHRSAVERRRPRITNKELAQTIIEHDFDLAAVAEELEIKLTRVIWRIDNDASLRRLLAVRRRRLVEKAERNLEALLDREDWKATRFTLETQGKEDGYTTKHEVETHTTTTNTPQEIDLSKLSIEDLQQLQSMMDQARPTIDITPTPTAPHTANDDPYLDDE